MIQYLLATLLYAMMHFGNPMTVLELTVLKTAQYFIVPNL